MYDDYDDADDDSDDNHIFAGTGLLSSGSELPGTVHQLHDAAMHKARPLARTKGHTDSGPNIDDNDDDDG